MRAPCRGCWRCHHYVSWPASWGWGSGSRTQPRWRDTSYWNMIGFMLETCISSVSHESMTHWVIYFIILTWTEAGHRRETGTATQWSRWRRGQPGLEGKHFIKKMEIAFYDKYVSPLTPAMFSVLLLLLLLLIFFFWQIIKSLETADRLINFDQ